MGGRQTGAQLMELRGAFTLSVARVLRVYRSSMSACRVKQQKRWHNFADAYSGSARSPGRLKSGLIASCFDM